ncbi:MAG: glycosyltransferase family 4 protein [Leptolyngbyaceae cyanobacterium]
MNLLYTLTAYPPNVGGAQLHQHFLAQQLQPEHSIQVATCWDMHRTDWLLGTTLTAPRRDRHYIIDNIPVHRLGVTWTQKFKMLPWVAVYYPFMSVALPPVAQVFQSSLDAHTQKADLIHNVRIGREGLTYASCQVARQRDIPFVMTPVHHPRWTGWRYREYNKLYCQADALIALTQSEKQVLIALGVDPAKIFVTGVGPVLAERANPTKFINTHGIRGPAVLFLGQHYPYKGFQQLLIATQQIWQQCPDAEFVFIGPAVKGSESVFAEFRDRRIHRLGTVSLQEKTDALAACDVLCVPSSQESFGGVYTEAWSFAKPVVGCNIAAVANVIDHGVDGFLVTQDPPTIAHHLIQLLTQPALSKKMGIAGKQKVQARYDWQKLAQRTIQIYQKLG